MRKIMLLLLALVLCFSLFACKNTQVTDPGSSQASTSPTASGPDENTAAYYVGEWKASEKVSDDGEYQICTAILNEDGTATYKGDSGTWEFFKDRNMIVFTAEGGKLATLDISTKSKKTVLMIGELVYYRASEFEEAY